MLSDNLTTSADSQPTRYKKGTAMHYGPPKSLPTLTGCRSTPYISSHLTLSRYIISTTDGTKPLAHNEHNLTNFKNTFCFSIYCLYQTRTQSLLGARKGLWGRRRE